MSSANKIGYIGERVSFSRDGGNFRLVILGKVERWKESLLLAWLLAWLFCGIVVMREYYINPDREMRMILAIFLAFWAYYLWKIGRTWAFRKSGNELITVDDTNLYVKRSIFTFGKSKPYFLANIKDLSLIELSKRSFAYQYENAWWVLGGERLTFDYQGKWVRFAMQLSDRDATELAKLLKKEISQRPKNLL